MLQTVLKDLCVNITLTDFGVVSTIRIIIPNSIPLTSIINNFHLWTKKLISYKNSIKCAKNHTVCCFCIVTITSIHYTTITFSVYSFRSWLYSCLQVFGSQFFMFLFPIWQQNSCPYTRIISHKICKHWIYQIPVTLHQQNKFSARICTYDYYIRSTKNFN